MRWSLLLAVAVLLCRPVLAAFSFSTLPKCSIPCLLEALTAIDCSATDFACQCKKGDALAQITQPCLQANCTMQETINLAKLQADLCDKPFHSRQDYLKGEKIGAVTAELFFVTVRISSRLWIWKKLSPDDWMIFVAALLSIASLACVIISVEYGFGLHLWEFDTSYAFAQAVKFFYFEQILYALIAGITKLSIIAFFLTIFPSHGFRIAAKLVFASIVCSTTIFLFCLTFQCTPVQLAWDKDIKNGKCLHFNNLAYSGAAVTIAQDIATLILPIPQLQTLHIDIWKKIGLIIMFSVGSLGCVASMVRLKFLLDYGISVGQAADPTYTTVPAIAWSGIEAGAGIVCACLPSIRILFRHVSSKFSTKLSWMSWSKRSSSYPANQSSSNRRGGGRKQGPRITTTENESEIELGPTRSNTVEDRQHKDDV